MEFAVTLYQDEDQIWIVECPSLPGCVSQGETIDEAMANIQDAIRECLIARDELGIPTEVTYRTVRIA